MGRLACTQQITSRQSSDSPMGWLAEECGPRNSISRRPGQHSSTASLPSGRPLLFLQKMMVPLLLASWCLLKADEPVIYLGLGSFSTCRWRDLSTGRCSTADIAAPPPRSVCVAYHGSVCSCLSFRLSPHQWWVPLILVPLIPFSDAHITLTLNEQIYMIFSEVFNLKVVYSCTFLYTCSSFIYA